LRSDQEDEEFEDDQEIIPPSHYVPATLSKRDSPIPADAEIFTIDDSDEDQQKEREQSVEEEFDELEHDDQMEAQDPRGIYGNVDEEADVEVVLPSDFTGDAVPDDISVAEPNQAERPHISMPGLQYFLVITSRLLTHCFQNLTGHKNRALWNMLRMRLLLFKLTIRQRMAVSAQVFSTTKCL